MRADRPWLSVPQPLQVVEHALRRLVPAVRLLLEQMHDDLRQRAWDGRVRLRRGHRHARQVIVDQSQRIAGAERRLTRGQLVERRAQRVEVGALIDRPSRAARLLRREIRQRPHDLAVMRELGADLGERGREREVHQAGGTARGDHDVRRGDVAVHHPTAVHGGQRTGQLHGQRDQVVDGERLRQLGEGRATRVLHHDRVGVLRRVHQLRHAFGAAQPLEHPDLVPEPALSRPSPAAACG